MALLYDDPSTGGVVILIFHQAIHTLHMMHNLLPPMQISLNEVRVNDQSKLLTENPYDDTHAIIFPNSESKDGKYLIPLSLGGVTSTFPTHKPAVEEYENCENSNLNSRHLTMISFLLVMRNRRKPLSKTRDNLEKQGKDCHMLVSCVQYPKVSPMPRTSLRQAHRVMQFCMTYRTP